MGYFFSKTVHLRRYFFLLLSVTINLI